LRYFRDTVHIFNYFNSNFNNDFYQHIYDCTSRNDYRDIYGYGHFDDYRHDDSDHEHDRDDNLYRVHDGNGHEHDDLDSDFYDDRHRNHNADGYFDQHHYIDSAYDDHSDIHGHVHEHHHTG